MGKKTFLSLNGLLPNRKHLVISSTLNDTENVKVYRNVQAAVDDSLADQTKAIRGYIESAGKDGSKLPVVLGVVNFALDIIILAVLVLHTMGIF